MGLWISQSIKPLEDQPPEPPKPMAKEYVLINTSGPSDDQIIEQKIKKFKHKRRHTKWIV